MDIDKIALITLLVVMILFGLTIFTYLIIVGADRCETEREKQLEDEEQIKYLKNYNKESENKWTIQ